MSKAELIEGPSINRVKVCPPQIVFEECPDNSAVINLWRSRVLSKRYTGNITDFVTNKAAELFKQGFEKVQIDCGRPGRTICGYRFRASQADKDASFFSSPETLALISSSTRTIKAAQHREKIRDYDDTGEHIFVTLKAEKG